MYTIIYVQKKKEKKRTNILTAFKSAPPEDLIVATSLRRRSRQNLKNMSAALRVLEN